MGDKLTIIMHIDKDKFDKFVEMFKVEEYTVNTRKWEVTINMTHLFDDAVKQYNDEMKNDTPTDTSSTGSSTGSPF